MSINVFMIIGFLALFGVTLALNISYLRVARQIGWFDRPNHRSSHVRPTPVGGGLSFTITGTIWLLLASVVGWISDHTLIVLLPGWLVLSGLGFLDDQLTISAKWRFLIQTIVIIYSVFVLGGFPNFHSSDHSYTFGWMTTLLGVYFGLWSINLFNFMDGTDGLAGIEAIFVLGVGSGILWFSGGQGLALVGWGVTTAALAFLVLNWPPAKLFMGDVGSCALGFFIFAMVFLSYYLVGMNPVIWLVLYGLFLFDATITLIRRIINGEKWYQAHRSHAYQRLHQAGFSHQKILITAIAVNSLLSLLAMMIWRHPGYQWISVIIALILLTWFYLWVEIRQPFAKHRVSDATTS